MAVFCKTDTDPGFAMHLCSDATLFSTVHNVMFMKPAGDESRMEVQEIVDKLREGNSSAGDVAFEDGWISLRVGMAEVTAFLMAKIKDAIEEERYADNQRFLEMRRRELAEGKYALLRQALVEALGDNAAGLAGKAAA
jgi:ATP-dependent Zn protease